MANEGQGQPPLPSQRPEEPPIHYGWQYDQEHAGMMAPTPASVSQPPAAPQQPPFPAYPAQSQAQAGRPPQAQQPPVAQRYQEPIQDMGTSLGYGQGSEYQYFDAPQPSQPMPQLRQARLQQLREERMRRQQRRIAGPDLTGLIVRKGPQLLPGASNGVQPPPQASSVPTAVPPQMSPSLRPVTGGPSAPSVPPTPPVQVSPLFLPPATELSPIRSSTLPPASLQRPVSAPRMQAQPAAEPSQDTGMLQRVNVARATFILTGSFIASRVLGLLRTSLFAFVFGTTNISDAYLQAFIIPDLIFNIIAGGALSSAFIPVFTKYMVGENDKRTAWHVASAALNLAIAIMVVLAVIVMIFAGPIVRLYNPGLNPAVPADAEELNLIIPLVRIMLLQSIILGGGVIVSSVLNARQNFLLPAVGTVLYNVGLIGGLIPGVFLSLQRSDTNYQTAAFAAAIGVVVGAILQVGIQLPGLRKVGMHYQFSFDWRHPGVVQIGKQMLPRIFNAAMLSFSVIVDRSLIQLIAVIVGTAAGTNGYITQYTQAFQLLLLPLGIFGMSVATAAFPTLAENVTKGRFDRVRSSIQETIRGMIYTAIPASVALIVIGLPIIQVLLEHGKFSLNDAQSTAVPLAFFAIGLVGLTIVEILTRAFYALRDSTTPVIVSIAQFILKIALSVLLINVATWGAAWGMGALAFSTSMAGLLEAVVLIWLLQQRIGGLELRVLVAFLARVLLAALAMGIALFVMRTLLDLIPFLETTSAQNLSWDGTVKALVKLLIEMFVGIIVYIRGTRLLGIETLGPMKRVLERLKLSWI